LKIIIKYLIKIEKKREKEKRKRKIKKIKKPKNPHTLITSNLPARLTSKLPAHSPPYFTLNLPANSTFSLLKPPSLTFRLSLS